MVFEFHHVVKDTADADDVSGCPVEDDVARALDNAVFGPRAVATVAQMIAAGPGAEFGAGNAAYTLGISSNVAQGRNQQAFAPSARDFAEIFPLAILYVSADQRISRRHLQAVYGSRP